MVRHFLPIFAHMKALWLILALLFTGLSSAFSQKQLVVADVETSLPVAGVSVQGRDHAAITDSLGRFCWPDSSRTFVFSHMNYDSRIVNVEDLGADTVFIVSKLLSLEEVVVFGKVHYEDDGLDELRRSLRLKRNEAQLLAADPSKPASIPLSLLGKLIPKKWRKSYKEAQRKKHHEDVLREY